MPYEIVRRAILQRRSLTATYEKYLRHFSPHALGRNRADRPGVIAFQYGGGLPGGLPVGGAWVCFDVDSLRDLRENNDAWLAGPLDGRPLDWLKSMDVPH